MMERGRWLERILAVALLCCVAAVPVAGRNPQWRPVVLMHGLMASAEAMSHTEQWIQEDFPGIYIHNAEIGNGKRDSLLMNINKQVDELASQLLADPKLQQGFNMVCHSQGGLLCRAYVERYNDPPVYNFMSWAGPQDGVYGVPDFNALCPDSKCPWLNDLFDQLLEGKWASKFVQDNFAFATYWKDPLNITAYLDYNIFLADINNERDVKNETYKENLMSLNTLALQYSEYDFIVIPRTSPWFEFYEPGSVSNVVQWNHSRSYVEDWIGLRSLNENGQLQLSSVPCTHQNIPRDECRDYYALYTRPLLNNTLPAARR